MKEKQVLTMGAMAVLENLMIYQYLTPQQMVMAGISPNVKTIRDKLIRQLALRKKPFVHVYDFGTLPPPIGRLPRLYCLSKYGVHVLAESLAIDIKKIQYPKGGVQFANDYFHRKICIEFHIKFRNWCMKADKELFFYDNYFGKVKGGEGYISQTAVNYNNGIKLIADSITMFDERMFALEVHNTKQTAVIMRQLENHLTAMKEQAISKKYQCPKNCPVLSLFTYKGTMEATKKRLLVKAPYFIKLKGGFLFNSLKNTEKDITQGWHTIDNKPVDFFV